MSVRATGRASLSAVRRDRVSPCEPQASRAQIPSRPAVRQHTLVRPTAGPAWKLSPPGPARRVRRRGRPARPHAHLLNLALVALMAATSAHAGEFVDLGEPVHYAQVMNAMVGPDADGHMTRIYANMMASGELSFLLQIDPATGEISRFELPEGKGAWNSAVGPDGRIYLGVAGSGPGVALWAFDPARPEESLRHVVDLSDTETVIWRLAADHHAIYGGTYPNALVLEYDIDTGAVKRHGPFTETGTYARPIFAGADGWVYAAIGTAEWDMIALDPVTGEFHSVRTDEQRRAGSMLPQGWTAWGRMYRAQDGTVYYWDNDGWHRLWEGESIAVPDDQIGRWGKQPMEDGRVLGVFEPGGRYSLVNRDAGQITWHDYAYDAPGSRLFMVDEGPGGLIYGSSIIPLVMFRHDPATGESEQLGNPTTVGGEIYSMVTLDERLWIAAYPDSHLSVYDPSLPWEFGAEAGSNPRAFGPLGDGHCRPQAMIVGPDELLYIGSVPDYGQLGGAMAIFDPARGEVVANYRNLVPGQSITALAYDPRTGLVFGGTSITGGGGSTPTATEAVIYAWDPATREIVWQVAPIENSSAVTDLAPANGKLFATVKGNSVCVLDPATGEVLDRRRVPGGWVHWAALEAHSDGALYGLTGSCIYRVDAETNEVTEVAPFEGGITCGLAVTDEGIYFGSGTHLWVYRW